jgi:hypothetical protein
MSGEERSFGWWRSKRDFVAGMAALAAGLALVVGACGVLGGGIGGSDFASLDAPCKDHLGQPLKARDVIAAFEAEGFTMHSLPESFYCNPDNLSGHADVADVSNQRSGTQDDEVVAVQGWATCHVSRGGSDLSAELFVDLNRGADSPIFAGTKAVFSVANVGCSLYPHGDGGDEQIARAHAAMKRLARQLQR